MPTKTNQPKTGAKRTGDYYARLAAAGLKRVEVIVPLDQVDAIKRRAALMRAGTKAPRRA